MFWIELLIAFLAVYINYAGAIIILHAIHKLYNIIRFHAYDGLEGVAFTVWILIGVMFFVLTVPLELILAGSIALNPTTIASEILIALIIQKSGFIDAKNI